MAQFGLKETTANCGLALKQVYLRYLDSYEKAHFLGDDNDDPEDSWYNDEEAVTLRKQRNQAKTAVVSVPLKYNHHQVCVLDIQTENDLGNNQVINNR